MTDLPSSAPAGSPDLTRIFSTVCAAAMLLLLLCHAAGSRAADSEATIGADDIGGTVASARGAEAGVWVIAETQDFKTRFAKIVVTDEAGRYLIPELPPAKYSRLGARLRPRRLVQGRRTLPASVSTWRRWSPRTRRRRPRFIPAAYWYAMMKIPEEAETAALPGGRNGYLMWMKNMGCVGCHQLGNLATRTIPKSSGTFESSQEAWLRRLQSGQAGRQMINIVQGDSRGHSDSLSRGLDRPHRRGRSFRRSRPPARVASSAMSSQPCATGRMARRICTICREPIGAIPPSTAMVCCTAPRN